jgi:excisionase family DNA binding protein
MEKLLILEEVVDYLHLSKDTVYRLANAGKLPACKVENQWRFRKEDVDQWLERNKKVRRDETGMLPRNCWPPYTARIIKAGALLPDTKALLSCWDPVRCVSENLVRIRRQNLLGTSSRSRAADILAIFRQRYLVEESVANALARLMKNRLNGKALDRILYFHSTRADLLLRDVVLNLLVPKWSQGLLDIEVNEVQRSLNKWVAQGKASHPWGENTVRRVSQGLLSTLRDFGVLDGAVKKRIAPAYLPIQAFAYIAFYLKQHQPSGAKLLELGDWSLFFLTRLGVERFFVEAHQRGFLEFHAAGDVIRLTFPVRTLEEYANVLT